MTLPSLSTFQVFVAVAKHRSFRRAAVEQGVSASAISHTIRGLEAGLGVRLFNRTSRSIALTAAGEFLYARAAAAVSDFEQAVAGVGTFRGRPSGTLRLNVPRSAADLVVRPLLARFLAAYPDIKVEVVSDDGMIDIVAGGFDAGIRTGQHLAQDMISVPVGPPLRFAVVGSPEYFAARPKPVLPRDLLDHACIGRRYPSGASYPWTFGHGTDAIDVHVSGPVVLDDRMLIVAAALDGIGLAHVHEGLVVDHTARGSLVRVLHDWCPALPTFFLYYPGRRHIPAPLRAFIDMARSTGLEPVWWQGSPKVCG